MKFPKKDLTLWLGLLLPVAMIVLILCSIYIPRLLIKPSYNFVYVVGQDEYVVNNEVTYYVENQKIADRHLSMPAQYRPQPALPPRLFMYDVATDESTELSLEQAQQLVLDSDVRSPDGFEIVRASGGDGIFPALFFSGRNYNDRFISNKIVSKKVNLKPGEPYPRSVVFLGWIVR